MCLAYHEISLGINPFESMHFSPNKAVQFALHIRCFRKQWMKSGALHLVFAQSVFCGNIASQRTDWRSPGINTVFPVLFVWVIYFRVYLLTWGKAQGNLLKSLHWPQVAFISDPKIRKYAGSWKSRHVGKRDNLFPFGGWGKWRLRGETACLVLLG